eukprot:CAMPEP_0185290600 /NCGR_PEP_ID=MMETSP1363-20130426/4719_1 /TAXON_ID=38817 /ORGANISM="Gephyrocapsa oceanica, Strain RCC1303" /LENGTH=175 /DNA_ID=CAMNT_0027886637 /DNA_START=1017 /DNA_END=1545 /DNA_ORIENTATION=+
MIAGRVNSDLCSNEGMGDSGQRPQYPSKLQTSATQHREGELAGQFKANRGRIRLRTPQPSPPTTQQTHNSTALLTADHRAAPRRTAHSHARAQGSSPHPTDRSALPHAHHHRPQALPVEPHRAAPGKPAAEQSCAASRRAIRSGGRGVAGHRSRGIRGLIRPDKTAIPTSRSPCE